MMAEGKDAGVAPRAVSWIDVDEGGAGQRIDNFLVARLKGVPKSHVYRILRSGEVRVNSGRVAASHRLALGDRIRVPPIRVAEREAGDAPAPALELPVLFEDDHILAVDKPAGLAVHGGSGIAHGVIERLRAGRPAGEIPRARAPPGPRDLRRAAAREEALGARPRCTRTCASAPWTSDISRRWPAACATTSAA